MTSHLCRSRSDQGEGGYVIMRGRSAHELLDRVQDADSDLASLGRVAVLQSRPHAVDSELFLLMLAFNNAAGNQKQSGAGFYRGGWRITGGVGEQAHW